jgi:hypothetical protein
LALQVCLERVQTRRDGFGDRIVGYDGVSRLQPVSGNGQDGELVWTDAAVANQLLRNADGNASGGLREYSLGLRKNLYARHNLRVGDIAGPASAFAN